MSNEPHSVSTADNTAEQQAELEVTAIDQLDQARRWRLMLGRYSDQNLSEAPLNAKQLQMERQLDYLYQNEYKRRGIEQGKSRHGSLDASQLTAINWLDQSRKLFPKSTFERMQKHAIER